MGDALSAKSDGQGQGAPVSVVVLTYNEQENIARCLDSVAWSDDIVVLDSHSTDETREIAARKGARVVLRTFDGYAKQRNFALREIDYRHRWLLMLDADEVVPPELASEIAAAVKQADDSVTLYRMRRRDYFMGKWLKHSTNYRSLWFGRLMRHERVWVEREINEEYHTDGEIRSLRHALIHYPFNKGLDAWLDKHNRYSSMEAQLIVDGGATDWRIRELVASDPVLRRKALKGLVYSLPGRSIIMFVGRYFISGGFLDGRAGLTFCLLKSWYEFMIECKVREARRRLRGWTV